jgi:hypothetical protein
LHDLRRRGPRGLAAAAARGAHQRSIPGGAPRSWHASRYGRRLRRRDGGASALCAVAHTAEDVFGPGGAMSLISVLVVLVVVGVILWLINTYIPMQGTIKSILNAVVIIVVVIWLLQVFGVLGSVGNVRIN